jgi:hypothetical protein
MSSTQFDAALKYSTNSRLLPGNVAPLVVLAERPMGVVGYSVADYLLQYVEQQRQGLPIPVETWNALLGNTLNPADLLRIARNAEARLLYAYSEKFIRVAENIDPQNSSSYFAQWLLRHGRIDELRKLADEDVGESRRRLSTWLAKNDQIDELRQRADRGEREACKELSNWLAASGEIDELRQRANAGDVFGKTWFPATSADYDLLKKVRSAHPSNEVSRRLADRLYDLNQIDKLRDLADFGDLNARKRLAGWLVINDEIDELRQRADEGDAAAGARLVQWLRMGNKIDELRRRADSGDKIADRPLADLLMKNGEIEELRSRADAGNGSASWRLADLLIRNDKIGELRQRADDGDKYARPRLANWLARNGKIDELRRRASSGEQTARRRLALWLRENNRINELRDRASAGEAEASSILEQWLYDNNHLAELEERVNSGAAINALTFLIDHFYANDDVEELRRLADGGSDKASFRLAHLLVKSGHVDELGARAVAGDKLAAKQLIRFAQEGLITGSEKFPRFGLNADGTVADDSSKRIKS